MHAVEADESRSVGITSPPKIADGNLIDYYGRKKPGQISRIKKRRSDDFDIRAKRQPQYNALDGKIHLKKFPTEFADPTMLSKCRAKTSPVTANASIV